MGINSAKSWFAVDKSGKIVFFTDYINVKNVKSFSFYVVKEMSRWQEFK